MPKLVASNLTEEEFVECVGGGGALVSVGKQASGGALVRGGMLAGRFSTWAEARAEAASILKLSMPLAITIVSFVGLNITDTAVVGHLGTQYLIASALADLWVSSTRVLVQGSVLGYFCGRAIGSGDKRAAGAWLQVSLVVLSPVALLVGAAWLCTGPLLEEGFGVRGDQAGRAGYYAGVLALSIPAQVGLSQLSQYYQAQEVTGPSLKAGLAAIGVNGVGQVCFSGSHAQNFEKKTKKKKKHARKIGFLKWRRVVDSHDMVCLLSAVAARWCLCSGRGWAGSARPSASGGRAGAGRAWRP